MRHILYLLLTLLTVSCAHRGGTGIGDFTETLYTPRYATGFEIRRAPHGTATLIVSTAPWQGSGGAQRQLVIDPDSDTAAAGNPDVQRIAGAARRIVCMSSTHVAMLGAIGCSDRIVGVSGIDFISDPYVTAHRDAIADVGYEPDIDYERIVSLDPDLVLLYGVTGPSGMESKLRELGIPYAYVGEYVESSPLGKAEWMVAMGEIAGCRDRADSLFATLPPRYDSLRRAAAAMPRRPRVMINAPYGDNWFMPSTSSYMARLIEDAGGDYIYRHDTGDKSETIDMEQAYLMASQADCWINVGQIASLAELRSRHPKFADVECVRRGRIYNCNRRTTAAGGNDFWESSVVHPDVVLRDLIGVFHPEAGIADESLYYYKRIE